MLVVQALSQLDDARGGSGGGRTGGDGDRCGGRRLVGDSKTVPDLPAEQADIFARVVAAYGLREMNIGAWATFEQVAAEALAARPGVLRRSLAVLGRPGAADPAPGRTRG